MPATAEQIAAFRAGREVVATAAQIEDATAEVRDFSLYGKLVELFDDAKEQRGCTGGWSGAKQSRDVAAFLVEGLYDLKIEAEALVARLGRELAAEQARQAAEDAAAEEDDALEAA